MSNFTQTTANDIGKLLLRLIVGGAMLPHGISKLIHGVDFLEQSVVAAGMPQFVAYGVYIGEVVGPVLLILGLFTRLSALTITIDMLMAFILVHSHQIFSLNPMGGGWAVELPAFYFVVSLSIFLTGGGKISLSRSQKFWA